MKPVLNGDTITDTQIHELHARGLISKRTVRFATRGSKQFGRVTLADGTTRPERWAYRNRCAEIWNAQDAEVSL